MARRSKRKRSRKSAPARRAKPRLRPQPKPRPKPSRRAAPRVDYDAMLRAVRGEARGFESAQGFKIGKLTSGQKRRVAKAFETIEALTSKPYKTVAPRSAKAQRALKAKALPEVGLDLKRIPVPVAHPKTAKVRVTKRGEIEIRQAGLTSRDVMFDVKALLKDPAKEVRRALTGVRGDKFHILAGDRLAHNFDILDEQALINTITTFMNEYGVSGEHAVGEWLKGVRVYDGSLAQFRKAAREYRKDNAEQREIRKDAKARRVVRQSKRGRVTGRR